MGVEPRRPLRAKHQKFRRFAGMEREERSGLDIYIQRMRAEAKELAEAKRLAEAEAESSSLDSFPSDSSEVIPDDEPKRSILPGRPLRHGGFRRSRRRPAHYNQYLQKIAPTEQDLQRKRKATNDNIERERKRREQTRLEQRAKAKKLAEAKRLAARPTVLGPRAEAESSSLDSSPSDSSEVIPDDEPKPSILPGWVTDAWKKWFR